jgi:serine/threonine protein kinase
VTHDGRPMLADFGISRLMTENGSIADTTYLEGSVRWMSIELVDALLRGSYHLTHTKESDMWAFGMVLFVSLKYIFGRKQVVR